MLSWIVRILLLLAASLATLLVPRDALNFRIVQTFVAIILVVAVVGLAAACTTRGRRARD